MKSDKKKKKKETELNNEKHIKSTYFQIPNRLKMGKKIKDQVYMAYKINPVRPFPLAYACNVASMCLPCSNFDA